MLGKHPVSLLNEFCAKRKWDIPKFNTLDESGPSHRKTFIMTVSIQIIEYSENSSFLGFMFYIGNCQWSTILFVKVSNKKISKNGSC